MVFSFDAPWKDITCLFRGPVDAGHLGLFMGRAALVEHWKPIAERVRAHS
jgi:hypothetical protein